MTDYGRALEFGATADPLADQPQFAAAIARLADTTGLDLVAVQDHPYNRRFLDTWTLLATLALQTQRLDPGAEMGELNGLPVVEDRRVSQRRRGRLFGGAVRRAHRHHLFVGGASIDHPAQRLVDHPSTTRASLACMPSPGRRIDYPAAYEAARVDQHDWHSARLGRRDRRPCLRLAAGRLHACAAAAAPVAWRARASARHGATLAFTLQGTAASVVSRGRLHLAHLRAAGTSEAELLRV